MLRKNQISNYLIVFINFQLGKLNKHTKLIYLQKTYEESKSHKSSMEVQQSDIQCQRMLYAAPPNLEDCLRHRKANIIFKNLHEVAASAEEVLMYNHCECCGRIVGKQPVLRLKYDPMEAAYLGPGIPLFFAFFRSVLYVMVVYLIGFGLYTTVSNIQGKNCEQQCGTPTFWNKISVFNIFDQYPTLQAQTYFELAIIIITIFVNISIRSYMNYLEIYIDQFFAKPSDYAIMIRNIPEDAEREDIQEMIERRRQSIKEESQEEVDLKVVDVLMVRELQEFLEIQKKNLEAIKRHIKRKQSNRSLGQVYYQNPVVPHKFARTAIVIFSSSKSKEFFLGTSSLLQKAIRTLWGSYYPKSNLHKIKQKYVSIYRAPEPDDLIWENCGKKSRQLLLRRIGLYLLSFIVLGLGGGIQYFIQFIRNKYVSVQNTTIQYLFSLGSALIVTIFNILLSLLLQFMAYHEGHDTKTQLKVAMTFRIVLFQFLNSGIFVVLSNIFVKITTDDREYDFRKTVLTSNIVQMMIVNAVMGNLTNFLINKYQIFKLYPRYKIKNQKKLYPQIQANKIFQPPQIFIHLKYAYIFKTFWLTVFFMPTVPPVIIISVLGLIVNYWAQKYLFSGAYTAPENISSYLSNHVLNLLDYTPLWLTFGSLFVHIVRKNFSFEDIQPEIKNFHYLFIVLSVINIFLPYYAILKRFNRYRQPTINQSTYQESVCTFELIYEDTNPVYKNHHKKRIRDEQIFKQKLVHEVEFKEMRLRLSQSQVLVSFKESLLNRSILSGDYGALTVRNRSSSLNF